jgi:mannose-6-phosphate isomerase-like protein (cupin superfamily)
VSYAIKNLRETHDHAPDFGLGEIQESHFPAGELGAEKTGFAFHVIRPGRRQGFAHRHEQAEEVYVVITGGGRIKLDDETVEIGPLDAVRVAPTVTRAFEAGPEGMELLAFGPRHKGDGEIVREGFWDD